MQNTYVNTQFQNFRTRYACKINGAYVGDKCHPEICCYCHTSFHFAEFLGSCLFFIFVAFIQEGIKSLRFWIDTKDQKTRHMSLKEHDKSEGAMAMNETKENTNYGTTEQLITGAKSRYVMNTFPVIQVSKQVGFNLILFHFRSYLSGVHLLQTFLHFLQIFNSYCLMLVVMTFNIYLILSICLGATLGFFVFALKRPEHFYSSDCCY